MKCCNDEKGCNWSGSPTDFYEHHKDCENNLKVKDLEKQIRDLRHTNEIRQQEITMLQGRNVLRSFSGLLETTTSF